MLLLPLARLICFVLHFLKKKQKTKVVLVFFRCFLKCSTGAKSKQHCMCGYIGYSRETLQAFNLQSKKQLLQGSTEKQTLLPKRPARMLQLRKSTRFLPLGRIDIRAISRSNNPVVVLALQRRSPRFPGCLY